jgi:hypothetical protein
MSTSRFLSKSKKITGMAIGAIAMLAMAVPALTQEAPKKDEVFEVTTAIQAPGGNALVSFDISWFDARLNKYFLADRSNNQIDVVDPSGNSITPIAKGIFAGVNPGGNDFSGPDGVLTVHQESGVTELWVGDSPGKVWVLNAVTGENILGAGQFIDVGGTTRADELCFDSKDHLIMIASPAGANPPTDDTPFVTFISTQTHKVVQPGGRLVFDGGDPVMGLKATNGLEQCGWSPKTGLFYQNVPEVNGPGDDTAPGAVAVIDPKTLTVVNSFPVSIDDCAGPQGMAIGPHNQIMLGCNAASPNGHRNTAMINIHSGATLAVFPDLGGADEVWFNEGDGHYFFPSCNTDCRVAGTGPEVLGVIDSKGHRLDQSVVLATQLGTGTGRRAHSVAADPDTKQVYVPIPATTGPGGNDATMCDNAPKTVGSPSASTGCILVFAATTHDDRSSVAQERGADDHQQ